MIDKITEYQNKIAELEHENLLLKNKLEEHKLFLQNIDLEKETSISEKNLIIIIDNLPILISHVSRDLKFLYINKTYCKIFGKEKNEIVGKNISEVVLKEAFANSKNYLERVFAGETVEYEAKVINKSEREKSLQIIHIPEFNQNEVVGFFTLGVDITERKKIENALIDSEDLLNKTGQLAKVGGWILNILTNKLTWSKETYKIHELTEDFLPDVNIAINFYHPVDRYVISQAVSRAIDFGEPFDVELRLITAKQNLIWVRAIGEAIKVNQKVVKLNGTFQDITEQKNAELELKKSKKLLAETGEIGKVGGWEFYIDTLKQTWTEETYNIHEVDYSFEPTVEKGINFYTPESKTIIENAVKRAIDFGEQFDVELEIISAKGNLRNVHAIGKADLENRRVYGFFQDVTIQKQNEFIINQQNKELKKLNADKDLFMQILAHDLKSPFNAILGLSELLLEDISKYDSIKIKNLLNIINQSAKRAYNLLEDLLLWSKSQSGKLIFEPQKIMFTEVCNEIINNQLNLAISKKINLNFLKTEKIFINVDLNMLKTILRNLISNAIKFTHENGNIIVFYEHTQNELTITVSDTGLGIEKKNQEKLWKISEQFTTTGTAGEKGSGLGLLLCKEFVEKHKGQIWVESQPGNGSNFKFTIPLLS